MGEDAQKASLRGIFPLVQFKGVHKSLFSCLLSFYKSSRTRILIVCDDKKKTAVDISMVLQPFEARAEVKNVWISDSLQLVEYSQSFDPKFDYKTFLDRKIIQVGKETVHLPDDVNPRYHSSIFYGRSWPRRYGTQSKVLSLRKNIGMPSSFREKVRRRIEDDVEFHHRRPYRSLEHLSTDLLSISRDFLKEAVVEIAAPFWARIRGISVNISDRSIRCEYEMAQEVHASKRLKGWHSYLLKNGSLVEHDIGWMEEKHQDEQKHERRYVLEKKLTFDPRDIASIMTTISLDDKFALESETVQLEVTGHILWPVLMKIDESRGGRLLQFLKGKSGGVKCDGFELAVANLMTSIGFRTALIGSMGKSGIDILAIPPDDDYLVLVECSRAGARKKVASCVRSLDLLKDSFPNYRFRGAVMIGEKVPRITREGIGRSDIAIFDADDIRKLAEHAQVKPDAGLVMDVLRGITDTVPEPHLSRRW